MYYRAPRRHGQDFFFQMAIIKFIYNQKCQKKNLWQQGNPLNEELKQEILSIDGVTDVIANRQTLHTTFKGDINQSTGICDMLTDQNYATVEAALTEGTMPTDSHSIVIDYNVLKQNEDMGVGSTVDFYFGEGNRLFLLLSGLFDSNTDSGHGKLT